MINWTAYPTPVGDLSVLVTVDGESSTVVAAGFCQPDELFDRLTDSLRSTEADRRRSPIAPEELGPVHEATSAYLRGDIHALDRVAVHQSGTELQQQFWAALREIPAGETRSYSELAYTVGRPRAVRAAGTACGRNLIAPYVPCHRVQRQDGNLGGYLYGLDTKRWLLEHEKLPSR